MASVSIQPKGMSYARAAIALALQKSWTGALELAGARWPGGTATHGYAHRCSVFVKQFGALAIEEWGELSDAASAEYLDGVAQQSVVMRLAGLVRVASGVPFVTVDDAIAHWAGEGQAVQISGGTLQHDALRPLRVSSFSAFPNELLRNASPEAEMLVLRGLKRAIQHQVDSAFIDPLNTGISRKRPASITHDAPTVAWTGELSEDMAAALDLFTGHLDSTSVLMHPRTALKFGLGPLMHAPLEIGVKGGSIGGMAVLCSEAHDQNEITLVDASAIAIVDQGISLHQSDAATVELDEAPTGDIIAPVAGSKKVVSLFATDSTGVIQSRHINWRLTRGGAVVRIVGLIESSGV